MAEDKCCKVVPKDHIAAFLENRKLIRETEVLTCHESLLDCLASNYVIVKQILSHLPWQDQLLCKCVSRTWCDAVRALQKEQLAPQDFNLDIQDEADNVVLRKSGNFPTEPLVIITMTNSAGFCKMGNCGIICPPPCNPTCGEVHWLLDCLDQELCYPKDCNLIVRTSILSYLPVATSPTAPQVVTADIMSTSAPLVCGLYLPKIPNLHYDVINIKTNADMKKDFYDVVNKMAEERIFKGFIVLVTDKYLLNTMEILFLNHFQKVQTDTPFALGGCIIEDAVYGRSDLSYFINDLNRNVKELMFVSENVVSISAFSVPRAAGGGKCSFEMYSLVVESSDWCKAKIHKIVKEFSDSVPRFEHSAVLKLSCVGRDEKHDVEQTAFRAHFPHTPLVGCYGNGELGLNHPPRAAPPAPRPAPRAAPASEAKRRRTEATLMYSYSTVFVYMGWGRVTQPPAAN